MNTKEKDFQINSHVTSFEVCPLIYPDHVKYTVMIPTHNRLETLKQAVDSLLRQDLASSLAIIIVDNNEHGDSYLDEYVNSLKESNVALYRNETNLGMIGNWNRCIELSPTERLIILHDDDQMTPGSIELLYTLGKGNEALIAGRWSVFGKNISRYQQKYLHYLNIWYGFFSSNYKHRSKWPMSKILSSYPISASGMSICKPAALSLGGYNNEIWPATDWSFFLDYIVKYGAKKSYKHTLRYRVELNSTADHDLLLKLAKAEADMKETFLNKHEKNKFRKYIALSGVRLMEKYQCKAVLNNLAEKNIAKNNRIFKKIKRAIIRISYQSLASGLIYAGLFLRKLVK